MAMNSANISPLALMLDYFKRLSRVFKCKAF